MSSRTDVFVSYSRKDGRFVRGLVEALEDRGRRCWVDWEGIAPSAEWMREVTAAIDSAQAFIFVVSPDSARSSVCREELDRAVTVNKRILPIVHRDVPPDELPAPIRDRHWLFFREADDHTRALGLLLKALDTDPKWAATHTRLLVRAVEWDTSSRSASYALRGEDLKLAERWLTEADEHKDPQPTRLHTEYIIASRRAATRSQRIRTAALAVGLVVAVALAAVALVQRGHARDQADLAKSRELAARSLVSSSTDPEAALSQAVQAGEVDPTSEAAQALRTSLEGTSSLDAVLPADAGLEDVAYSGDGELIAAAGDDGIAYVWTADTGERRELDTGASRVLDLAFAADARVLALATGGVVELWRPDADKPRRTIGDPSGRIRGVALSPDGKLVAGASSNGIAKVWRTRDGHLLSTHREPGGQVYSVAFNRSGDRVVSAGQTGRAYVWTALHGRPVAELDVRRASRGSARDVNDAQFDASGHLVVTASSDGVARIWDVRNAAVVDTVIASTDELRRAELNDAGDRLLTAGFDGVARVWAPPANSNGGGARHIVGPPLTTLAGHGSGILGAEFSPDGDRVATASADQTARVWESEPDDSRLHYDDHRYALQQVAFAPDGDELASAAADGTARVWDATTGETLNKLVAHGPYVVDVSWSADGNQLATASWDGKVVLWALPSGDRVRAFRVPKADYDLGRLTPRATDPAAVRISPDGTHVIAVTTTRIIVWDARTGQVTASHAVPDAISLDLSADGSQAALALRDATIRIVNPVTGEVLETLVGHEDQVDSVEFSPDGRELVSGSEDRTARIWDLTSGSAMVELLGHTGAVYDAAFNRDASRVVTGGADRTVRVWDAHDGTVLDVLNGNRAWVTGVDFSADGSLIASAGLDRVGRIFGCGMCVSFESLMSQARDRLARTDAG